MPADLADRKDELAALVSDLDHVAAGRGRLVLLAGETGVGKSRLAEEALRLAAERGFHCATSRCVEESVGVYHAWEELLRSLDLAHLLDPSPPPRLWGLYLVTGSGLLAARAERERTSADADIFAAMTTAVGEFISQALAGLGNVEGPVLRMSAGSRGMVVRRAEGFAVAAVIEGRENEGLLADLGELCDGFERAMGERIRRWQGKDSAISEAATALRWLLASGKYDGVDYARDDPRLRQGSLFHAVALALSRRGAERPLALLVEDLQWADPSSLALLQYVARNCSGGRVLLLSTYRADGPQAPPHLAAALASARREFPSADRMVEGMKLDGVAELVTAMFDADVPDELPRALLARTGGNPLFVIEAVREMQERGALAVQDGVARLLVPPEAIELPAKAQELVRARLERLQEDERATLEAAAVLGPRFSPGSLARLMGEPETRVLRIVHSVCRARGLLRTDGDGFLFDQPSIREALYSSVPRDLRRAYHQSIAESLLASGGAGDAEVGEHLYRAQDPRCAPHLQAAGEKALEENANEEAARLFRQAADHLAGEKRALVLERMSQALYRLGRFQEGVAAVDQAEPEAPRSLLSALLVRKAECLDKLGRFGEATDAIRRAVDAAEGVEKALAMREEAFIYSEHAQIDKALEIVTRALDMLGPGAPPKERGLALNTLAICYHTQTRFDEALAAYEQARSAHEQAGYRRGVAAAMANIASVLAERGERTRALEHCYKAMEIMEAIGNRDGVASLLTNIGVMQRQLGRHEEATESQRRALRIHESTGNVQGIATTLVSLGSALAERGEPDEGLRCYLRALEMGRAAHHPYIEALCLVNVGDIRASRTPEEAAEALSQIRRGTVMLREIGDRLLVSTSLSSSARHLLVLGRVDEARAAAEEAAMHAREIGARREEGRALAAMASVEAAAGRIEQARKSGAEALRILEATEGATLDQAETFLEMARIEARAGAREAAAARAEEARALFEKLRFPKRAAEAAAPMD